MEQTQTPRAWWDRPTLTVLGLFLVGLGIERDEDALAALGLVLVALPWLGCLLAPASAIDPDRELGIVVVAVLIGLPFLALSVAALGAVFGFLIGVFTDVGWRTGLTRGAAAGALLGGGTMAGQVVTHALLWWRGRAYRRERPTG